MASSTLGTGLENSPDRIILQLTQISPMHHLLRYRGNENASSLSKPINPLLAVRLDWFFTITVSDQTQRIYFY